MIGQRASRFFLLAADRTRFWVLVVTLFCLIPQAQALRTPLSVQPSVFTKQTSPLQTRARVFEHDPSGRYCFHAIQSPANATGCEAYPCETASGRPRWLNRDPIGERGGINLYQFCNNEPLGRFDPFGLDSVICVHGNDKTNELAPRSASGAQMLDSAVAGMQKGDYDYVVSFRNPTELRDKLRKVRKVGVKIDNLIVLDHGAPGLQEVGDLAVRSPAYIPGNMDPIVDALGENVEPGGTITLLGCNVGEGDDGKALMSKLAESTGKTIEAYTGATRIPTAKPPKPTGEKIIVTPQLEK